MLLRFMFLLLANFSAQAADYGNVTINQVTSIYDADTLRADIEGWPDTIGKRISVRVNGIDAPELKGKCQAEKVAARKSKQHTVELLCG